MTCATVMNTRPLTLRVDAPVSNAVEIFLRHACHTLPVVDAEGRFAGLFGVHRLLGLLLPKVATLKDGLTDLRYVQDTLADVRRRLADIAGHAVGDYLDEPAAVLRPDTPIMETLLMLYHHHDGLPVVEEASGRLLGIVSFRDVLDKIAPAG